MPTHLCLLLILGTLLGCAPHPPLLGPLSGDAAPTSEASVADAQDSGAPEDAGTPASEVGTDSQVIPQDTTDAPDAPDVQDEDSSVVPDQGPADTSPDAGPIDTGTQDGGADAPDAPDSPAVIVDLGVPDSGPRCLPTPEVCDGVDNDCNGLIDEGFCRIGGACFTNGQLNPANNCQICVVPSVPVSGFTSWSNVAAGTICRAANTGRCDVAESCRGDGSACPADTGLPAGTVCHLSEGICDLDEVCNGSSAACPLDTLRPMGTVCRPSVNRPYCDPAETCTGLSAFCPANTVTRAPSTEVCDLVDNDCDGQIDEDLGTLSCGVGVCRRTLAACLVGDPQVCVPGPTSQELCNHLDDDCDGLIDEGFAFQSDRNNCGSCGNACPGSPMDGQSCSAGVCVCPAGTTLCGSTCVDLNRDVANCGRCGSSCGTPGDNFCSGGGCCTPGGNLCRFFDPRMPSEENPSFPCQKGYAPRMVAGNPMPVLISIRTSSDCGGIGISCPPDRPTCNHHAGSSTPTCE